MRIFLVENHTDTRTFLRRYLEQQGHEVHAADTMEAALREFAGQAMDVLVSDINLPDGDGWELLARLRQAENPPACAIAMSGFSASVSERSRTAGYWRHLAKPFLPEDLDALLAEIDGSLAAPPVQG